MDASALSSFVYSINFQIRQIQTRNQHFSEKHLLLCGSRFLKKKKKKKIPANKQKETYFAIRKILPNFERHDHWYYRYIIFSVIYIFSKWLSNAIEIWTFDATSRVYSRPILRSILRLTIKRWPPLEKLFQTFILMQNTQKRD